MPKYSILTLFAIFITSSKAQTQLNQSNIDSLSYTYYMNGEWKNLLVLGKQAQKLGIEGYWLNLRVAFAAKILQKPFLSQHYYNRNLKQFPNDLITLPLAYENQLAISQYSQALRLQSKLKKDSVLNILYPKRPVFHLVHIEYGIKQCSNDSFYKPLHYGQVGVGFRINRIAFYNALSSISQQTYFGTTQQYQYYVSASIPIKYDITITPAYHYLSYTINTNIPFIPDSVKNVKSYVVGGSVSKVVRSFILGLGFYRSNMNFTFQNQIQPTVTWYPFSNTRLSIAALGNYLAENNKLTGSTMVNYAPIAKLNLTGGYLLANVRYFTEQNGYLVNNSFDITRDRWLASVSYNITPALSVYGVYLHEQRTIPILERKYQNNMGVLGIKTTF